MIGRDQAAIRDDGRIQSVTRRAIAPDDPAPKRDLRGSDKAFAVLLPGSDTVCIVEGGTMLSPPTTWLAGGERLRRP